jgi:hypothetical protein
MFFSATTLCTLLYNFYSCIWLGNLSVDTTRKTVSQLKSISHRLNFIVYRHIFRSSWDHHQAVYIINTVKLIEISIWIHILGQRVPIIKILKAVENCAFCYDENYNIEKYIIEILEYTKICI